MPKAHYLMLTQRQGGDGKLSVGGDSADWEYAHSELLEREGVDLKLEMEQKMREMEEQWRKEKEEATQAFQQERKKYEDQIESLQKQVRFWGWSVLRVWMVWTLYCLDEMVDIREWLVSENCNCNCIQFLWLV